MCISIQKSFHKRHPFIEMYTSMVQTYRPFLLWIAQLTLLTIVPLVFRAFFPLLMSRPLFNIKQHLVIVIAVGHWHLFSTDYCLQPTDNSLIHCLIGQLCRCQQDMHNCNLRISIAPLQSQGHQLVHSAVDVRSLMSKYE